MTEKRGLYQAYVEVTADPEQRVLLNGDPAIQLDLVMPGHGQVGVVTSASNLRGSLYALVEAHDVAIAANPTGKVIWVGDEARCACCDWLNGKFDRVMADWW